MPGENTDSWRACWREMASGEAEESKEEGRAVSGSEVVVYMFYLGLFSAHSHAPLLSPVSSLT